MDFDIAIRKKENPTNIFTPDLYQFLLISTKILFQVSNFFKLPENFSTELLFNF